MFNCRIFFLCALRRAASLRDTQTDWRLGGYRGRGCRAGPGMALKGQLMAVEAVRCALEGRQRLRMAGPTRRVGCGAVVMEGSLAKADDVCGC